MPSFTNFALATAFLAVAAARAASPVGRSFTVKQVAVPASAPRNGAAHLAKAHAKYRGFVPSRIADAVSAASTGSVVATSDEGDSDYLCEINVGGITLNLDFDTGSSDLYVTLWMFARV